MKIFGFLLCFLLCVLARNVLADDTDKIKFAQILGISLADLEDCLNKVNTDFDTIMELGSMLDPDNKDSATQDTIQKVGCFGACLYKKNGIMVNSRILPEKAYALATRMQRGNREDMARLHTVLRTCSERVSNVTNDCNITYAFSTCVIKEMETCRNARCT